MTCSRSDLRAMGFNNTAANSGSNFDMSQLYPERSSAWQRKTMDSEQRMANTMQLHKRRFEYLDTKVKGL